MKPEMQGAAMQLPAFYTLNSKLYTPKAIMPPKENAGFSPDTMSLQLSLDEHLEIGDPGGIRP